jgi:hypothetical protein
MSLLQRVTSVEQLSPERGTSPSGQGSPRERKLSFSPLPGDWDPPVHHEHVQPIGAFEVPKSKRICENLPLPINFIYAEIEEIHC